MLALMLAALAQSDGLGPTEIPEQNIVVCGYVTENKRFWRVYKHSDLIEHNANKCPSEVAPTPEESERARKSLPYRH
jgi:hypothetical protein